MAKWKLTRIRNELEDKLKRGGDREEEIIVAACRRILGSSRFSGTSTSNIKGVRRNETNGEIKSLNDVLEDARGS